MHTQPIPYEALCLTVTPLSVVRIDFALINSLPVTQTLACLLEFEFLSTHVIQRGFMLSDEKM